MALPLRMNRVPQIFVGSSSETLSVAKAVRDALPEAQVTIWNEAFKASQVLLNAIVESVPQYDFAVFIFGPDDVSKIRKAQFSAVRDNVLFEAGVFMGGLGVNRTFLITTSKPPHPQRIPSDLAGLLIAGKAVRIGKKKGKVERWDVSEPVRKIRLAIEQLGPAPRNPHNEILYLRTSLVEHTLRTKHKTFSLLDLVRRAAANRNRPWLHITEPRALIEHISDSANSRVADDAYWWLVVEGVFMFDGIDHFTSDESWNWSESIDYVHLSDRGVALLNDLRREANSPRRRHRKKKRTK